MYTHTQTKKKKTTIKPRQTKTAYSKEERIQIFQEKVLKGTTQRNKKIYTRKNKHKSSF